MPEWFSDFLGLAYRYFDLRMNVAPLFPVRDVAASMWRETMHWWLDSTIRFRFVESGNRYWFITGAESRRPESNLCMFKVLDRSPSYERFKRGYGGEAYLRFGVYTKREASNAKDDAVCECGHERYDHGESDFGCLFEDCPCKEFESFEVKLLRNKKTVTDIAFLDESEIQSDPLAWNCVSKN